MRRLRPGLAVLLGLVSLALLSAATPAWAHTGSGARLSNEAIEQSAVAPQAPEPAPRPLTLSATPVAPGIPWPALAGALVIVALGWRRPRRALVFAVVLLLAVFAFEDGLHSVHHLVDRSPLNKCAVAAAAAQLNAIADGQVGSVDVILPVVATLTEVSQTDPVTSFLSPVQGRAPPTTAG